MEFDLAQVLALFKELQRHGSGIGRRKAADKMKNLTEYKARKLIKALNDCGYVKIGKTKQGTTLTPLGRELLRYLEKCNCQSENNTLRSTL